MKLAPTLALAALLWFATISALVNPMSAATSASFEYGEIGGAVATIPATSILNGFIALISGRFRLGVTARRLCLANKSPSPSCPS